MTDNSERSTQNDIAIIGMACRFPQADTPNAFWANLCNEAHAFTELSDEQLREAGVSNKLLSDRNYVKGGMFLDNHDGFDAEFFGFSPLDAKILDPQHRHFLECSWEAFEDAGYVPGDMAKSVGVFAGSGYNAYLSQNLLPRKDLVEDVGFFLLRHTGNDKDFLSTRVSYLLNLKGPSVNVQTACSTSLVAVHLAVQSLLSAECDMALAGGVTIELPHRQGYLFKENEILSPDGFCRPFDADSKGTVFGSGAGCVLLKRYDDALEDRDNIHAVIRGVAVNNDGLDKVSYLAPSVDGQAAAIAEALAIGEVDPNSVTLVECHGTGTQLGDPIELAALNQAYYSEDTTHRCAIGSVKSNIGHTDTAAGVASLIKVTQALKHEQIPATLHFNKANPSIDFSNSPFYVNAQLKGWDETKPLRAGVSSLGVGGTNAHVIVEQFVSEQKPISDVRDELVLLSAKSEMSLQKYKTALVDHLDENGSLSLKDISYTLANGRKSFRHRSFAVVNGVQDLSTQLDSPAADVFHVVEAPREPREAVFMFAGGGSQHVNMGKSLYADEPVYRQSVDNCLELIEEFIDFDIRSAMFPENMSDEVDLARPSVGLPALFITQYAQAQLWMSWGVPIDAMIGHSMGENTAATLSGVFSLKDALGLVALRGKLFETVDRGGMISVSTSADALSNMVNELDVDIAAINAPELCVASGSREKLDRLQQLLTEAEIEFQPIHIDVAAHSRMLESILEPFRDYLASIALNKPEIDFISNLTGNWIKPEEAIDPGYWVDHLRHTVRFEQGLSTLISAQKYVFLEVGPGKTLSSLARLQTNKDVVATSMAHIQDDQSDRRVMLSAMGALWQGGAVLQFEKLFDDCSRVSLPTYQFAKNRHWVDVENSAKSEETAIDVSCGHYLPVWMQQPKSSVPTDLENATVLLIAGKNYLNGTLSKAASEYGANVILVKEGSCFEQITQREYTFNPGILKDYDLLLSALTEQGISPDRIIHTLALDAGRDFDGVNFDGADYERDRMLCFDSLLLLARSLIEHDIDQALHCVVVTCSAVQVAGERISNPLQSLALGPCRVIPSECPNISCSLLDIESQRNEGDSSNADAILHQLCLDDSPPVMALRGFGLYTPTYQYTEFNQQDSAVASNLPDENCTYLITGGIGGLGLIAAETLAKKANVNLVLLSRRSLPDRDDWQSHVHKKSHHAATLTRLMAIEEAGSKVVHFSVDVSNFDQVQSLKDELTKRFGQISGIIHTAGVVDDNPIAIKTQEQCDLVLNPKVLGTINLNRVFDPAELDFMLLYSSISSFAGLPGQIDYSAANCFLDTFAAYSASQGHNAVTSINWPVWQEDGMAARLAAGIDSSAPSGESADHPWIDCYVPQGESKVEYSSRLSVANVWMLDEHRLANGIALIPGSGFIELARAAYFERTGDKSVMISNATFLAPFLVDDENSRDISIVLESSENNRWSFTINSGQAGQVTTHATGFIEPCREAAGHESIDSLTTRCSSRIQYFDDPDHHPNLVFGDRWSSLRQVRIGREEAVVELELAEQYVGELSIFPLHPALLDMATAGAQALIPEYEPQSQFYVPVGYGLLKSQDHFSPRSYSHVVLKSHNATVGTAVFDVSVYDSEGNLILSVAEFTMQRLNPDSMPTSIDAPEDMNPLLAKTMELGIRSDDGAQVLDSLITGQHLPQRIITTLNPIQVVDQLTEVQRHHSVGKPTIKIAEHDPDIDEDLPEIESVLRENDAIEFVAVRSHRNEDGSRRLVAHYMTDDWEDITVSELRKYARATLERRCVPQHFIELDEIPRDDKGEIDRIQLVDPYAPVDRYVAPRNPVEQQLADIWAEVLGADRVSVTDNFFDIGGHSLLSIRVIVKAQKVFSVQLDQAQMVLLTLEQLASDIETRLQGELQPVDSDLLAESSRSAAELSRGTGSTSTLEGDFR